MKQLLFVLLLLVSLELFSCASNRDRLQRRYPYARLTDDYGILNEHDLKVSEENAVAVPFSDTSQAYPYWKCFPTLQVKFACLDLGPDEKRTPMADILVKAEGSVEINEYGGRHGVPLDTCQKEYVAKSKDLMNGMPYVCIAGQYVSDNDRKPKSPHKRFNWIYDRLKTQKGCASYFTEDCSTTKE